MCEIVELSAYRAALLKLAERDRLRHFRGLRFRALDVLDYFVVPSVCGRDDSFIYLKVDDTAACPWAKPGDETAKWFYGMADSPFSFNFDHPVASIDPNQIPPS